jgi:Lon protease-like protein
LNLLPETIPVFPLPNHVFLPGVPIPYHIFELRYQAMIRDLKALPEEERWIAIPQMRAQRLDESNAQPDYFLVATVGRVVDMLPVGGGRCDILVEGEYRCSLSEVHSPNPYRLARPTVIPDVDAGVLDKAGGARPGCFRSLDQGILALVSRVGEHASHLVSILSSEVLPSVILYRLGATLLHDPARRQAFLELRSIAERADYLVDTLAGLLAVADRHQTKNGSYDKS